MSMPELPCMKALKAACKPELHHRATKQWTLLPAHKVRPRHVSNPLVCGARQSLPCTLLAASEPCSQPASSTPFVVASSGGSPEVCRPVFR